MKRVQVLLSTYNGEKYLKEQIESIMSQKNVDVSILARDDGSGDHTLEILKSYNNIEIIEGENKGATNSFLDLIELAGEYDFYAFSDQDDVWDDDKLETAINALNDIESPAIYSGNTRLVDQDLQEIRVETNIPRTTLGSAITKNYVTGCTEVFNSLLMKELKKVRPQYAPFHDWWTNLVCLSLGGVSVYDYQPHMCYRQHGDNVVGGNETSLMKWKSRFQKFTRGQYHRDRMAGEILKGYEMFISQANRELLQDVHFCKYNKMLKTGNVTDDLLYRICLLFGKS